ncbi:hypothetical protein [Bradyrhizobium sp. LjRoot220]|uniref:hypothetical protein n=1 Tax=Bradyrhizobium sp. LjRoot220 TaxID=3342284 RepID=UPI003F504311
MVAVAATVELIICGVGDGDGVGVGVGEGVGVGVGVGLTCACADVMPKASTNMIAASRANALPPPILSARDAQRINFIPKKSARPKKAPARKPCTTSRSAVTDLRPDGAERQLLTGLAGD